MEKRIVYSFLIIASLLLVCCSDDSGEPAPVIEASDFIAIIDENPLPGQSIGFLSGSSNKGDVTFSLASQTPEGAFILDGVTGELTVGNEALFEFDTNPHLTAIANVSKDGVSKTVSVTVNLIEAPDIYFTGVIYEGYLAAYWKNGLATVLSDHGMEAGEDIAVDENGDVYVAGYKNIDGYSVATIWKNGVETLLGPLATNSYAHAVTIAGVNVFVAGMEYVDGTPVVRVWKNGNMLDLFYEAGEIYFEVTSIAANESEVYVAGQRMVNDINSPNNGKYIATMLKLLGESSETAYQMPLTDGSKNAFATSVEVFGDDVYVTGYESGASYYEAKYWKNGDPVTLTDGVTGAGFANAITVNGGDVYVAGYEHIGFTKTAKYWKNGIATPMPTGSPRNAEAYAIEKSGEKIFVLGKIYSNVSSSQDSTVVWRNSDIVLTMTGVSAIKMDLH